MSKFLTKIFETRTNGGAWRHIGKWRESLDRDVLRQLGQAGPQN